MIIMEFCLFISIHTQQIPKLFQKLIIHISLKKSFYHCFIYIRQIQFLIKLNQLSFQHTQKSKLTKSQKMLNIDRKRCIDLIVGIVGIYLTYLSAGIIHEWMIKIPYDNWTGKLQTFNSPIGLIVFATGSTWIIGTAVNYFTIPDAQRTFIPAKNSAICAFIVLISTLTYTYAIYMTSFPIVMMVKSCNILSVVLVGILCSRVTDKKLKLGPKKLVVGLIVTAGIIIFKWFDPEAKKGDQKKTQILGLVLLFVSLLADGFLPDFQAQIKVKYKPQPMQMMTDTNKWVCWLSIAYSILIGEAFQTISFIMTHPLFGIHILGMGILSTFGQMFVYRMIKQFKQHFVPFVITTRKIMTVGLSIIYYHHQTNIMQVVGILITFGVVFYQFLSELMSEKKQQHGSSNEKNQNKLQSNQLRQEDAIQTQPSENIIEFEKVQNLAMQIQTSPKQQN